MEFNLNIAQEIIFLLVKTGFILLFVLKSINRLHTLFIVYQDVNGDTLEQMVRAKVFADRIYPKSRMKQIFGKWGEYFIVALGLSIVLHPAFLVIWFLSAGSLDMYFMWLKYSKKVGKEGAVVMELGDVVGQIEGIKDSISSLLSSMVVIKFDGEEVLPNQLADVPVGLEICPYTKQINDILTKGIVQLRTKFFEEVGIKPIEPEEMDNYSKRMIVDEAKVRKLFDELHQWLIFIDAGIIKKRFDELVVDWDVVAGANALTAFMSKDFEFSLSIPDDAEGRRVLLERLQS